MCYIILARTNTPEIIDGLAKKSTVPAINGLDTCFHPTQMAILVYLTHKHFVQPGEETIKKHIIHIVAPGKVVLTWTDDTTDPQYEMSKNAYEIAPVFAREIILGGGNIHCITQQQPK